MHSNTRNYQPSWTLFFSWGGFVFLAINFFTGMLLSKTELSSFVLANVVAFVLLALTLFPTVFLSIKHDINYSEAIRKFVQNTTLQKALILTVILINLGWYAIQLVAVKDILQSFFEVDTLLVMIFFSYLFAYGSYRFEYLWLKYFSVVTIILFLAYLVMLTFYTDISLQKPMASDTSLSFFSMLVMLYGTWAFSSSTVVMDIARYTKDFLPSYIYILLALLVSNFSLIALGYTFGRYTQISSFGEFVSILGLSFGILLLLLNIWSTNDSNFFSSQKALKTLGIKKKYAFLIFPFIGAFLAIAFQDDLFGLIGGWLKLMGWIAIPLTLFWWYQVYNSKKQGLL